MGRRRNAVRRPAATRSIEFRNAVGRVIAVSEPVEDPDWVKAITPEETARRMAESGYTFDEMKQRLSWE